MRNPFPILWNYIRPAFEGPDGKFSYKRASQMIFVQLIIYMVAKSHVKDKWTFLQFLCLCVLFAFTAKLIRPQDVVDGLKATNNKTDA